VKILRSSQSLFLIHKCLKRIGIVLAIGLIVPVQIYGQPKLKLSGSVNGSAIGYSASGIEARRDPLYWLASANVTASYWQISAPFSFTVSQQDHTFRYPQPFNQFGISPTYKSVTAHLGYRSLNFSEFTLAGIIFAGVGLEIKPSTSAVKISAMYGRLAKARLDGGLNDLEFGVPSYERWGYGTRVTLGKNGQEVDFIVFRGRDNPSSIPDTLAAALNITPAENFIWGVNVRRSIVNRFTVNVEYALSAFTKDVRDPSITLTSFRYANHLGDLYSPTISSQFNGALQAQVNYQSDRYQLNAKYRRLGPEYKTMGSPFMNNDFEDITGGVSTTLLSNKLNLSLNAGLQHNNLDQGQETTVSRFIGSAALSYSASARLNTSLSYGNFNTSTRLDRFFQQSQIDQVDSLLYLQVTNNVNISATYALKQGDISTSLTVTGSYQIASDNQENDALFYNGNVGYQINNTPLGLNATISANINSNAVGDIRNVSAGPSATVSKLLFDKQVRATATLSYIRAYQSGRQLNDNQIARFVLAYTLKKKHTFGFDFSWLNRISQVESLPSFSEVRAGVNYGYSFSN
jgi:hypothetical protein